MMKSEELERRLLESEIRIRALEERVVNLSAPEMVEAWTAQRGHESSALSLGANSSSTAFRPYLAPLPLTGILRARRLVARFLNNSGLDGRVVFAIYRANDGRLATRNVAEGASDTGTVEVSHEVTRSPLTLVKDLGSSGFDSAGAARLAVLNFVDVQLSPWRALYFVAFASSVDQFRIDHPYSALPCPGWIGADLPANMVWPQVIQPVRHATFMPAIGLYSARGALVRGGG